MSRNVKNDSISFIEELALTQRKKYYRQLPSSFIARSKNNKPYFIDNKVQFSGAHSGDLTFFAMAEFNVAVDIEVMKMRDYVAFAKEYFHENECLALESSVYQKELFYKIWTFKEAFIKFHGLSLFDIGLCPDFTLELKDMFCIHKKIIFKNREYMTCILSQESENMIVHLKASIKTQVEDILYTAL